MSAERQHARDLVADHALYGLACADLDGVVAVLGQAEGLDVEGLERAVASATLALVEPEPIDPAFVDRLEARGRAWLARGGARGHEATARGPGSETAPAPRAAPILERPRAHEHAAPARPRQTARRAGWWAAAAATVLAVAGWWPHPEPSPAEARRALLATADDVVRVPWTATEDPAARGAGGDVVWSPSRQAGFMTFAGLAPNDPARQQYQLWIFDATRDERYPVDGGVFDVEPGAAPAVVPFDAAVPVERATLFAVTVERPGGTVVSTRERLPLLASVP